MYQSNNLIFIDDGVTFECTPFIDDTIPGALKETNISVKNLLGNSKITAKGFGRRNVTDKNGLTGSIKVFLHVVPNSEFRLFIPVIISEVFKVDRTIWIRTPLI